MNNQQLEYYRENVLPIYTKYTSGEIKGLKNEDVQKIKYLYIQLVPAGAYSCWQCGATIKSALESLNLNYDKFKPVEIIEEVIVVEVISEPLLPVQNAVTLPSKKRTSKKK